MADGFPEIRIDFQVLGESRVQTKPMREYSLALRILPGHLNLGAGFRER